MKNNSVNSQDKLNNHIIFRNYSNKGYWEISGPIYTTYITYDLIDEENPTGIILMLALHGIKDMVTLSNTLIRYTKNPQNDMFLVEI